METTYCTFRANEIVVSGSGMEQVSGGEGRRMVYLRRAAPVQPPRSSGKVIHLDAWKSAHPQEPHPQLQCAPSRQARAPHTQPGSAQEPSDPRPAEHPAAPSPRRERGMYWDWLASLALIAVAAAACVSFLM